MAATTFTMTARLSREQAAVGTRAPSAARARGALALAWALALLVLGYTTAIFVSWPVPRLTLEGQAGRWLMDVVLLAAVALHYRRTARPSAVLGADATGDPQWAYAADVAVAAVLLGALVGAWQPLPGFAWQVSDPALRAALWGGWVLGWVLAAGAAARMRADAALTPGLELLRIALRLPARRSPGALTLGVGLAGFSAPDMTPDHLLVAIAVMAWLGLRWFRQSPGAGRHR